MKQGLQLKFSQNLSLTPQLQQAIKLLQLSSLELNQEIDLLMQTNPLLERGEDGEDEYGNVADDFDDESLSAIKEVETSQANIEISDQQYEASESEMTSAEPAEFEPAATEFSEEFGDEYGEFSNGSLWDENNSPDDDDSDFRKQETLELSLREHLLSQLKLMQLSERDQRLTLLLVDSINEDGYLEASLAEIVDEMPLELEIEELELQTALRHIQNLDPIGVGARDLSECLLLQLNSLPDETPNLSLAKLLAKHYLQDLASRDFTKLRKYLGCDEDTLKSVQQMITSLNPRPGSGFSQIGSEHFIQHEVVVKKTKGIWVASLNDAAIPKLKINQLYAGILKRNRDSNSQYLQSQMQEAKWMIKNIQQRFCDNSASVSSNCR